MSDSTTPQDDAAMSPASTGSVVDGPLAWCVISDFYYAPVVSADEDAARRLAKGSDKVLALYPHPPLTDAERLALDWAATTARDESQIQLHKTLRSIMDRLK